ncbi:MAG: ASCH domain-containing protein [Mesorhizobium sp.]|nr:MAG: ASCH domain-containing protein [Mesorhizobium sp.]
MTDLSHLPDHAISIMQPWAWLIVNGHKDIENRDWHTNYRGPVAIHAGKKVDSDCNEALWQNRHPVTGEQSERTVGLMFPNTWERGGIVGVAEIVDCVSASPSEWFVGRFGFIIRNARPVDFIPCKGALSFFAWKDRLL